MATVLFSWELGGGLGHLVNMLPLVRGLRTAGHRVFLALRDLSRAKTVFEGTGAILLQAPYKPGAASDPVMVPRSFAHVLWNIGFGDPPELEALVDSWRNLFDLIHPDLIVFEHSPTALLAARGSPVRKVTLGNGFSCPPDMTPFPDLRTWYPPDPDSIVRGEEIVLRHANAVLHQCSEPLLERLGELHADLDDVLLTTFAEFDHYPDRGAACYRGPWYPEGGESPQWPAGANKRVFVYVRHVAVLPKLLTALKDHGCATIVTGNHIPQAVQRQHAAENLRFDSRRLDHLEVARTCDVAIINANHATTLAMHLAGKPVLQIPLFLEQDINAAATVKLGAGISVAPNDSAAMCAGLEKLLHDRTYSAAAGRFASRYAAFSQSAEISRATTRLLELLTSQQR